MAGNWDKVYVDGDRIYHYEQNDIIEAIKHTGPLGEAELMHTFNRNNGNQAFKIDSDNLGTFLYGQNALSYTRFNNDGSLELYSDDILNIKAVGEVRLNSTGSDIVFMNDADQMFKFAKDSGDSKLYGAGNLVIYKNETSIVPRIDLTWADDIQLYADLWFTVFNNGTEQTFKTFKSSSSDHATWFGSNEADIGLLIRANEIAGGPYLNMHNGDYGGADDKTFNIFTKGDFVIESGSTGGQIFKATFQTGGPQDYVKWFAGGSADTKLTISPTNDSETYLYLEKDGDITLMTDPNAVPNTLVSFMDIEVYNGQGDGYSLWFPDRWGDILTGEIYADSNEGWLCINGPVDDMVLGIFQYGIRIDATPAVGWAGKNYIEIGKDLLMIKSEGDITLDPVGSVVLDNALNMSGNAILGNGPGHNQFSDFVANEHVDHSTVSITAGSHLTGGGDITSTRTLDVSDDWYDSVADIPTATPSDGDTTHLSTCDQIYDWVNTNYSGTGHNHDSVYLKLAGGTMVGGIDMNSNSLSNLNEITTATDTDLHLNPNGSGEVKFGIETLNAGSDRGKLVKLKTDAGDTVYVKTYDLV